MLIFNPYIWFLYICEFYMYWYSKRIISPLEGISLYFKKRSFKNKVCVISNRAIIPNFHEKQDNFFLKVSFSCCNSDIISGQYVNLNELRKRFFIVGYSGSIDRDNDTDSLLEAALRIDEPEIIFAIVGDGVMKTALMQRPELDAI